VCERRSWKPARVSYELGSAAPGVDLVFARRGEQKPLAVQVKSRRISGTSMARGTFRAQVSESTFTPRDDLHMLYVAVDPAKGTLIWRGLCRRRCCRLALRRIPRVAADSSQA